MTEPTTGMCPACDGVGYEEYWDGEEETCFVCSNCSGSGEVPIYDEDDS